MLITYFIGFIIFWGIGLALCIEKEDIEGIQEFIVPIIGAIFWPIFLVAYLTLVAIGKSKAKE